jgi:hypothetical protein
MQGRFFFCPIYPLFRIPFLGGDLDIEADQAKEAHIDIGQEDQTESREHVAAPVREEKGVLGHDEECDRHIMAQAVFAREHVEHLAGEKGRPLFALPDEVLPRLAEDLFMRDRPGDAGHRDRKYEKRDEWTHRRRDRLCGLAGIGVGLRHELEHVSSADAALALCRVSVVLLFDLDVFHLLHRRLIVRVSALHAQCFKWWHMICRN